MSTEKDHVDSEYDLAKSKKKLGALMPIIMSKDGDIVEGFHRAAADKKWPRQVNENLDTPAKIALAKIVANLQRRDVPSLEKIEWVTDWAEAKIEEGFKGDLVKLLAEETGFSKRWAQKYLPDKFKKKEMDKKTAAQIEPDRDQLVKIDLAKGLTYRQIRDKHGCGASTIRRLVLERAAELEAAAKEKVVKDVVVITDEEPSAIPDKAKILHKEPEPEPIDPMLGVTEDEVDLMLRLNICIETFTEGYTQLKEAGLDFTAFGQNIFTWVDRFKQWNPFEGYKNKAKK